MNLELYKQIKKDKKLTYEDIAALSGISRRTIAGLFAGDKKYSNPSIVTVQAIEHALGMSSDITPEERAAGASETIKMSITPMEDEMLYLFREIGKKHGEKAQRALITVAEKML